MWPRRKDREQTRLVAGCETFLRGTYAEHLLGLGDPVPPWAWLNLLAHATDEELRAAAREPAPSSVWQRARWFLAGEILDAVDGSPCSLDDVQHDVLVRLELAAASSVAAKRWGPDRLVNTTRRLVRDRTAQTQR
jgi:hypothetical protein